jgi:hypothetical protein
MRLSFRGPGKALWPRDWPFGIAAETQIAEVAHIPNEFTIVCSFQTGQDIGHPVKK